MLKSKLQVAIIIIGLISTVVGIWTMLQTPTMILSPWFLVGLYFIITFFASLFLAFVIKLLSKSSWHILTFVALLMTIICLTFYVSQYKPNYKIIVPNNFVGQVNLLVSNEHQNDFKINNFGIGYITQKTYKNGFRPTVIKAGHDISDQILNYSTNSFATTSASKLSFDYLSFKVPGKKEDFENIDFDSLLKLKAFDTAKLWKK